MLTACVDRCRGVLGIFTLLPPVGAATAWAAILQGIVKLYVVGVLHLLVACGDNEASVSAYGVVGLVPLQFVVAHKPSLIVPVGFVEWTFGIELVAPYECAVSLCKTG